MKNLKNYLKIVFCTFILMTISINSYSQVYHGKASYYGGKLHGRKTASGEVFNQYAMTCAHKTLPFGTILKVTNKSNGKTVTVRVTDRGPYCGGRIIDLSYGAAKEIGMLSSGVANVSAEIIKPKKQLAQVVSRSTNVTET